MTIGGGGPCVQVEQFRRREGAIGVVPARARVTRLGCCDDADGAVTITASGDTFRSQTFATNFSLIRAPAATASQPANCVDTTLTIDDSQNHANIVYADGMDTTTLTVSLSKDPLGTFTRYLRADFGTVESPVRLSSDSATTTYTAGTFAEDSTSTTTAATVEAFRNQTDQTSLCSVTVLNYDGFDFRDLEIPDSEMIVSIPSSTSATALNTTVSQDATVIQDFFETNTICANQRPHGSFLRNFYINTHTKEGFYDQDEDGSFDSDNDNSDLTGDILYEPPMGQNDDGDDTRNRDFSDCTGTVAEGNRRCGETISAAVLMARLASCENAEDANSGNDKFDCSMKRSHRVTPRNMLVTLQKENSLTVSRNYPTHLEGTSPNQERKPDHKKVHEAMGCGVTDDRVQNLANLHLYNFYDQIDCAVDTFVERYGEAPAALDDNDDNTNFFHNMARGVRHGYDCSDDAECTDAEIAEGKGPIVTFFVDSRMTWVQYKYTPWIQGGRIGGGVRLFHDVWTGCRFTSFDWSGGSE